MKLVDASAACLEARCGRGCTRFGSDAGYRQRLAAAGRWDGDGLRRALRNRGDGLDHERSMANQLVNAGVGNDGHDEPLLPPLQFKDEDGDRTRAGKPVHLGVNCPCSCPTLTQLGQ